MRLKELYFLPPRHAATLLELPVSVLNKLRIDSRGPKCIKIGRQVLYPLHDLLNWLPTERRKARKYFSI